MPIITPKGLSGLKGIGSLSKADYDSFVNRNKNLIEQHDYDPDYISSLYRNKQFIDKFGLDAFKAVPDINLRNTYYEDAIVNEEWDNLYKPKTLSNGMRDINSGLGADYEKYSQMSTEAKRKMLESDYLTDSEFEDNWQREIDSWSGKRTDKNGHTYFMPNPIGSTAPIGAVQASRNSEFEKKRRKDRNDRILERIYSEDGAAKASQLNDEVSNVYANRDPSIFGRNDKETVELFKKAITPNLKAGYQGIPEYASHYGIVENGISSEMENFSIDEMREVLAKKAVYEQHMSPDMAATVLNDEAKKYIHDHQSFGKKAAMFSKDVLIAASSYSMDKANGFYNLGLMAADELSKKGVLDTPQVFVDDEDNILALNDERVVQNPKGGYYYQGEDGKSHALQRIQIDRTTLHNMGKNVGIIDSAGSEDESILNPQDWTRREQFGVWDKDIAKEYEIIGSSPYKVAYNPNEDRDLLYESFKMMSFGLADAGSQLLPFGIGLMGKGLSTASHVGNMLRNVGAFTHAASKFLTAETKVGQVAQGLAGAVGIAEAYQRGAFQETLAYNLSNLEESVLNKSKQEIYDQYHSDKNYKNQIDRHIAATAASMKAEYIASLGENGRNEIVDEKAIDEMLRARAQDAVLGELVSQRTKELKSSEDYAAMQEEAINSAGDAATRAFLPEAVKYGLVNTFGFRKYLYSTPTSVAQKAANNFKGIREITTSAGRKRLATDIGKTITNGEKWKNLGKAAGTQAWGGAWTNGSDDMMVDAAERINEDSYRRYLNAYENGEGVDDTYGFMDGLFSYWLGLQNSLGQQTTGEAALVGALGSTISSNIHFTNIASLFSKEGREAYRNNFLQRYKRDEDGQILKGEDGKPIVEDISRKENWRDRFAFFVQNGVLSEYYGKKQALRDLQFHADYVNNLLDDYDDFNAISKLVASDIGRENAINIGDEKTMRFVQAFQAVDALERLGKSEKDPATLSSIVQENKALLERASQLNNENNDLSPEELQNFIAQYYAQHPGLEQSEENNQKALQDIAKNAQKLQEAYESYNAAEQTIQSIEKETGTPIMPVVREKLKLSHALDKHWRERLNTMKEEIGDHSSEEKPTGTTLIATYGGKRSAENILKQYAFGEVGVTKEVTDAISKQQQKLDEYNQAQEELREAEESEDSNAIFQAQTKLKATKEAYEDATEERLLKEDQLSLIKEKQAELSEALNGWEKGTKSEVLSANTIMALDPSTRARMMDKRNRHTYNERQKKQIEKLETKLRQENDGDPLQKIQDISLLTYRIQQNEDSYNRILRNPEAAALRLERQQQKAAEQAYKEISKRNAYTIVDYIHQMEDALKGRKEIKKSEVEDFVYKTLRRYNKNILNTINSERALSNFQKQVDDALEWSGVLDDIEAVISQTEESEEWKENLRRNVDSIVESSNNKKELMTKLEKVIDDISNPQAKQDIDKLLQGLSKLGYQRDAVTVENREKRKAREAAARAEIEKQKKAAEEAAKKAAEEAKEKAQVEAAKKQLEEQERKNAEAPYVNPDGSNLIDADHPTDHDASKATLIKEVGEEYNWNDVASQLLEEGAEDGTIEIGEIWTKDGKKPLEVSKKGDTIELHVVGDTQPLSFHPSLAAWEKSDKAPGLTQDTIDQLELEIDTPFEAKSIKRIDGKWYFYGNFAGISSAQHLEVSERFNFDSTIEEEKALREAEAANKGIDTGNSHIIDNGDTIQGQSPSVEEQMEEVKNNEQIHLGDIKDLETPSYSNARGEKIKKGDATTLSGNGMSRYNPTLISEEGIIESKKGDKKDDPMNQYFAWMDAAGIKLQNIIDHELGLILQRNPNAKVKFMVIRPDKNATNDIGMVNRLMLVLDYDNSINKGITSIHQDSNGGVIESQGKKYLVVGVVGYERGNREKQAQYDILFNPVKGRSGIMRRAKKDFFEKNPSERFFVHPTLETEIVPYSLIPGFIVNQLSSEESRTFRRLLELINDPQRNPHHLDYRSLMWLIQERTKPLVIGTSLDRVMAPEDVEKNAGSTFVLVPASNGKLMPSYIKPLFYKEMSDGSLKNRVNSLLNDLVSPNYSKRYQALLGLSNIFYFNAKEGDSILVGKDGSRYHHQISLVHNGQVFKTFTLDAAFDKRAFDEAFADMNPRVNITATVLQSPTLIKEYDEAGALTTDIATLSTAGSSYEIYAVDKDGQMLAPTTPVVPPSPRTDSDFRNTDRGLVIFKGQYYREDNGVFYLSGIPITDKSIISQLRYNQRIIEGAITPVSSKGVVWSTYILSEGEHPEVVEVNKNTKEVRVLPEEKAKEIIKEETEKRLKKEREERAKKEMEEKMKENKDTLEDVDLGLEGENFTIDPETGEFIFNPQPAPKTSQGEGEPSPQRTTSTTKSPMANTDTASFNTLSKSKQLYKGTRLSKVIRDTIYTKWPNASKKPAELEKFLRDHNIEVDAIGTSDAAIEAWIKTVEECR